MPLPIVLGSSSKSRREILARYMDFTTISPDIDEKAIRHEDPLELTLKIANEKIKAIEHKCRNSIVICLDQVVMVNNKILEKPESQEEARYFINLYNTYPARCISGLVVKNTKTGELKQCNVESVQEFRNDKKITSEVIDGLVEKGDCLWCAGALIVEDELMKPFIVKNDYEEAVMGLPIREINAYCEELQNK
eukprot:NODE_321_length_11054_cov_0.461524.p6 type:complete len:193 gc:universal NODE_321_length_11054_cov_0.461524:8407-7829(-)